MILLAQNATDWLSFIGRLHPLMVHMPIGLFAAVVLFELFRCARRSQADAVPLRLMYFVAAASAVASAIAGWFLAVGDEYASDTLFWHRWLGIGVAVTLAACALLVWSTAKKAAQMRAVMILITMGLIGFTGHLGGTLTHGEGYLTRYAPPWLGGSSNSAQPPITIQGAALTEDAQIVLTMLQDRCVDCHGPTKQKSKLRLDEVDGIQSMIVAGDPASSELFRRISLSHNDDDFMPPDGDPIEEGVVHAVMRWIRDGAAIGGLAQTLETELASKAEQAALLEQLRTDTGAIIIELPGESPTGLRVDFSLVGSALTSEQLSALNPVAPRVEVLSFAGRTIDASALASIGPLDQLDRLDLQRSSVDDHALGILLGIAPNVQVLNLHSTRITADAFTDITRLKSLQRVVLFETDIAPTDLTALADAMPSTEVIGPMALVDSFTLQGPRMVLAADASKGRIALMREVTIGRFDTVWEHAVREIHDLHVLENGHILFQDSWTHLVEIDPETKQVIWEYDAATTNRAEPGERVEVHAFQRLTNGITMIAESGPARIIEVDQGGKLISSTQLTVDRPDAHHDTRLVRKTPTGTYLVAHENDGVVREYNADGEIVWAFDVPLFDREAAPGHSFSGYGDQLFAAIRLKDGNTLIGTGNGHSVIEVNPEGEIVWRVSQDELEGVQLAWVTTVQELSNGNIVIGNCHAGPDQPQIIEITRDKEVVWKFHDFDRFGDALSNSVIIEDTHRAD